MLQTAASKEYVIGVADSDYLQRSSDRCNLLGYASRVDICN